MTPAVITAERWREALMAYLPRGIAWPRDTGTRLAAVLLAIGDELTRLQNRARTLLVTELDPRTANLSDGALSDTGEGGLLEDWERVLGLPEAYSDTPIDALTLGERRAAAHAKWQAQGGATAVYFIALADTLGYVITIDEPLGPWRCDMECDNPVYEEEWAFAWIVNAEYSGEAYFRCDGPGCDAPLADYGTSDLVQAFELYKPAHTTIHWEFAAAGP